MSTRRYARFVRDAYDGQMLFEVLSYCYHAYARRVFKDPTSKVIERLQDERGPFLESLFDSDYADKANCVAPYSDICTCRACAALAKVNWQRLGKYFTIMSKDRAKYGC